MTRGNQRELARARNAKKQMEATKGQSSGDKVGNKGMTLEARRQRDAELMRLKQQKAEMKKNDTKK